MSRMAATQALIGIAQVLLQGPLGLPGELALEPTHSGAAIIAVPQRPWLRAYGMTFHPNVLGGFLAVGLVLGPIIAALFIAVWRIYGEEFAELLRPEDPAAEEDAPAAADPDPPKDSEPA